MRFLEAIDPRTRRPLIAHTKGEWAGRPFRLLAWQRDIMRHLFGTCLPDGRRQYRKALIGVGRKNGKSAWASALALYLLIADGEPGAEIYAVAADRDQARVVFGEARKMLEASPLLQECAIFRDSIVHRATNSVFRVLSSDAPTKHGLNPHAVIFDELHAQPDRELWDVLTTAQGARRQPLTLAITTAGFDKTSLCYELYEYGRQVAAGDRDDPQWFFRWYGADLEDDWRDRAAWKKANPSLGETVSLDFLEAEFREAESLPGRQNTFRTLYLNQWTEQATRWLDLGVWDAQAGPPVTEDACLGRPCCGGLDLASVSDLTSWVLLFPANGGGYQVLHRSFVPESQLDRQRNPRNWELYRRWVREGYLLATPGDAVDYAFVKARVLADCARFDVRGVGIDRLWQGQQLMTELLEEGVPCREMGQGYASMGPATKSFEKAYLDGTLHHGGDPVLRWAVRHAVVRRDPAGNQKIDKDRSQEKVDPIVALVMALDRVSRGDLQTREPTLLVFGGRG